MGVDPTVSVLRSLLQKAVRMSAPEVAVATVQALRSWRNDAWVSQRLQVIAFEEAHHIAFDLGFPLPQQGMIAAENELVRRLCLTTKDKSATGLASLALATAQGSPYVRFVLGRRYAMLDAVDEVMSYLRDPEVLFDTLDGRDATCARAAYKSATFEWDRAFVVAAAYLRGEERPDPVPCTPTAWDDFPWHLAYDKHSPTGKIVMGMTSTASGVQQRRVEAVTFLCGSGQCCDSHDSVWWEAERARCLRHVGLTLDDAYDLYAKVEPHWIEQAYRFAPQLTRGLGNFAPRPPMSNNPTTRPDAPAQMS